MLGKVRYQRTPSANCFFNYLISSSAILGSCLDRTDLPSIERYIGSPGLTLLSPMSLKKPPWNQIKLTSSWRKSPTNLIHPPSIQIKPPTVDNTVDDATVGFSAKNVSLFEAKYNYWWNVLSILKDSMELATVLSLRASRLISN